MDHSVRAYLERMPVDKLRSFLENDLFDDTYVINDGILQEILEALISRNTEPGSHLSGYIHKIQKLQDDRKQTDR